MDDSAECAPTPDKNCTHLAGEYFVAAELYRRGFSVGITMGNAKAIDLLAERGLKTVNVQVKAVRVKKHSWTVSGHQIQPNVMYVFVCLGEPGTQPMYFILTPEEAKAEVKDYSTRGELRFTSVNSAEFQDRWDKLERAMR